MDKNKTPKDRKAKEQARAKKKLTSERIRALQTAQKTTPQKKKRKKEKKKELGGRWLRKTA